MSIVAVPTMLAPILGPTIGGLILDSASWRWIFFVNVPIGMIALVAVAAVLRARAAARRRLDVRGLLLMVDRHAAPHLRARRDRLDRASSRSRA